MITRLRGPAGERVLDHEVGRFVEDCLIPCHRCGVCCQRWQPLVTAAERERLAAYLGITAAEVEQTYTTPYPFDDDARLLRHEGGGCVFLTWDGDGRSACSVHPARPDACREWLASLARGECVDGLARFGSADAVLSVTTLYPDSAEQHAFERVARGLPATPDEAGPRQ
jgi:Fe-S-cluster containining protein